MLAKRMLQQIQQHTGRSRCAGRYADCLEVRPGILGIGRTAESGSEERV